MKKTNNALGSVSASKIIALLVVLGLMSVIHPQKAKAQKAGVGITYGDKLSMVGGQVGATYRFHQYFRMAGNVSVSIPKEFENSDNQWNWWSINVDGNFVPVETGRFRIYLLSGLNYATIRIRYPENQGVEIDSGLGLNAGGGMEYSLDIGDLYTETKYIFSSERYQQIAVNVGIRFYLMPG